jgi:hypothetical protein
MNKYELTSKRQKDMDEYILQKDIPGVKAGAIFVHDKEDKIYGSIMGGCLKLAWDNGNAPIQTENHYYAGLAGGTIIFHASVIEDKEWFVKRKSVRKISDNFKETLIDKLEDLVSLLKSQ